MTPDAAPVMIRLTDLAARMGVGKAAMSERVSKLEDAGLISTVREGRSKLIDLAAFERATSATVSLAKMAGAATRKARTAGEAGPVALPPEGQPAFVPLAPPAAPVAVAVDDEAPATTSGVYTKAQAERATYMAALAKLDLDQKLGKVVPVSDVTEAMARCAEALVRGIDQMAGMADDIAAAVAKNGASGARAALKAKARDLRELLAREMRMLGAPEAPGD